MQGDSLIEVKVNRAPFVRLLDREHFGRPAEDAIYFRATPVPVSEHSHAGL